MDDKEFIAYQNAKASIRFVRETALDGELVGWKMLEHKRMNCTSSRIVDKYWFSPKRKKKLRSRVQVQKFIDYLREFGSDKEDDAFDNATNRGTKRKKAQSPKKNETSSSGVGKVPKRKAKISNSDAMWVTTKLSSASRRKVGEKRRTPAIQESKQQVSLPPEKRQKLDFAEAALAAFREYQARMASEKPDPTSAFDLDRIAEPKEGVDRVSSGDGDGREKSYKGIKCRDTKLSKNTVPSKSKKKSKISERKAQKQKVNFIRDAKGVQGKSSPLSLSSDPLDSNFDVPEVAESKDSCDSSAKAQQAWI